MKCNRFNTFGYFIKNYFNWSMDYADLENLVEEFKRLENKEEIETFKNEMETLYILNDPDFIRRLVYNYGKRGMTTEKAINMIKLLYIKTQDC